MYIYNDPCYIHVGNVSTNTKQIQNVYTYDDKTWLKFKPGLRYLVDDHV